MPIRSKAAAIRTSRRGTPVALLSLALFAASSAAQTPATSAPAPATLPTSTAPATQAVCGRLTKAEGLPVLELWGSPEEAGYAQGYLLAENLVALFDGYVLDPKIIKSQAIYENLLLPNVRRQMVWEEKHERELTAILKGAQDRLGADKLRSSVLERDLTVEDLLAANVLSDWFGLLCSSFSVWGERTYDGQTITARNLDFPPTPIMNYSQLVVIRRAYGGAKAWIGVSWPGLIGVYSAMNEDGVCIFLHDAPGLAASAATGFTPRSLILREALESAGADSYVEDVKKVFAARKVMVGNNVHVSAAGKPGRPNAAIFEYDANSKNDGVTVRLPQADDATLADLLCCTNQMHSRRTADGCPRYDRLVQMLTELGAKQKKIDANLALGLIERVRQSDTLHTVIAEPAHRTFYVRITARNTNAVEFRLSEWLRRPTPPPQSPPTKPPPTKSPQSP